MCATIMKYKSIFESENCLPEIERTNRFITVKSEEILAIDKFDMNNSKLLLGPLEAILVLTCDYVYVVKSVPEILKDKVYLDAKFKVHLRWMVISSFQNKKTAKLTDYQIRMVKGPHFLDLWTSNVAIYNKWLKVLKPLVLHDNFFDKYNIIEFLGSGCTAKVYKVVNKKTEKAYACKRFDKKEILDPSYLQTLTNEITILTKLRDCPEVAKLIEVHETNNSVLIIMELMNGGRLTKQNIIYSQDQIFTLTRCLLLIVNKMASRGIIHKDLKPGNILIKNPKEEISYNNIKLIDFGFALQKPILTSGFSCMQSGTIGYVPPEVLDFKNTDINCDFWDIYSIGVIIYSAMTGTRLFDNIDYKVKIELNRKGAINFEDKYFTAYPAECKLKSSKPDQRNVERESPFSN